MKHLKMLGLAALSATALMAFVGAGTASATTLEVGGVQKNESLTITASLKTGTSAVLQSTLGFGANTCTASHVKGKSTTPFTETTNVTGPVEELAFTNCQHPVTVHKMGQLYVDHEAGTTNGNVYSENAEVTVWSTIHGTYINCTTGGGVLIGTLTGTADTKKHAELHIHAILDCVGHISSATWKGTYIVTSPTGFGVRA